MAISDELQLIDFPRGVRDPVKIAIDVKRGVYDEIIENHLGHPLNVLLLREIIDGKGTLIDVGANIGTIALPLADTGCNVLAIEMLPRNVLKLTSAVLANRFRNVCVVQAAASSRDGLLCYGGSEAWAAVASKGAEAVCYRLDTICRMLSLSNPGLLRAPLTLKIDVEGHEAEVLRGAEETIREYRPYVLFESIAFPLESVQWVGHQCAVAAETKRMLASQDYLLFVLYRNVLAPRSPEQLQEGLVCDFLAIPREKMAHLRARLKAFELRELTLPEIVSWMVELSGEGVGHKIHALKVIKEATAVHPISAFREPLEKLAGDEDLDISSKARELIQ